MTRAYLGLGSNLGDRLAHLQAALDALATVEAIAIAAVSHVYETAPVGGPDQDDYLNAVVAIDTGLTPRELLGVAMRIEQLADRVRAGRWGPRTLDVDILLYGDERIDDPDLEIPHPRMRERGFVLAPLHDVAPERVETPSGGWEGVTRTPLALRVP
ncbi:MAG: 2-amino-4-hydroxy-6-hydroxymethyldihydropteridine diphosphokinase [Acidimicrobiia bacterium]